MTKNTHVTSLNLTIDRTNVWVADVAGLMGTADREFAFKILRAWLHTVRDALPVVVAAHVAAQLPELLTGVFYNGWDPAKVPVRYSRETFIQRFVDEARVHRSEAPAFIGLVYDVAKRRMSPGGADHIMDHLHTDVRELFAHAPAAETSSVWVSP